MPTGTVDRYATHAIAMTDLLFAFETPRDTCLARIRELSRRGVLPYPWRVLDIA